MSRLAMVPEEITEADISHGAHRVWVALKGFENQKTGQCNPKQPLLATKCRMRISALKEAIRELKKAGFLITSRGKFGCQYTLLDSRDSGDPLQHYRTNKRTYK